MSIRHSRTLLAVALSVAFQQNVQAAADEAAIVVTATRTPTRASDQLADITTIDRDEIERAGATTLPQLLSMQPGLQIAPQGGPGKIADIFIRGTSSGHTLLLVDGVPIGSLTLGAPSLSNMPLYQIERVEILRAPASGLYGSDALGGVVQIFTRKGEGALKPDASVGFGSYGTSQIGAGLSGESDVLSYSLRASEFRTRGFNIASDSTRFQQVNGALPHYDRDGYSNTSWSGRLAFRPAPGHEIGVTALTADSRNKFDSGGDTAIDARNDDETTVWSIYSRNRFHPGWTSTLRYGQSIDRFKTWDMDWNIFAAAWQHWESRQDLFSWQNDIRLPVGTLMLATEHLRQNVDSTTAYTVRERKISSQIIGWQGQLGKHNWQVSQRYDDNSQFGGKASGGFSYGYRLTPEILMRGAAGTAFKAPTFNQLYWPNTGFGGGNPNLQPETAKNREAGLEWSRGSARVTWTHFDNRISNMISGWPPVNIGRARITGDSLAGSHAWGAWSAQVSVDLMKPINEVTGDRLQRRAARLGKGRVAYSPEPWGVGMEMSAVGERYDTTTQTRPLARYELVNLFGHYRIDRNLTLEGRIDNLTDKTYETAWGYANPGVSVFVGLRYAPK